MQVVSIILPVLLVFIGYAWTYFYNQRVQRQKDEHDQQVRQQKDQLARVTLQLENLYGPLFVLTRTTTETFFLGFMKMYDDTTAYPGRHPFWNYPTDNPMPEDLATWRLWIEHVFQPQNLALQEVIDDNMHLLDDTDRHEKPKIVEVVLQEMVRQEWVTRIKNGEIEEHIHIDQGKIRKGIPMSMLSCLLLVCAHVSVYKAIVEQWHNQDYSEHIANIMFPREALKAYTEEAFNRKKKEQDWLLGILEQQR